MPLFSDFHSCHGIRDARRCAITPADIIAMIRHPPCRRRYATRCPFSAAFRFSIFRPRLTFAFSDEPATKDIAASIRAARPSFRHMRSFAAFSLIYFSYAGYYMPATVSSSLNARQSASSDIQLLLFSIIFDISPPQSGEFT